jgi:DNA mismatch repair protein MutL
MSAHIIILPDHVVNRIAAGEVVERPASVVKELIENSIDAGASEIFIDIEQAGRRLIRVTDNGCGMSRDDAQIAFQRHATSKIRTDRDLEAIRTMGFRGEALSSIASVSQVRLLSALKGEPSGVMLEIEAGEVKNVTDAAAPQGSSLAISHLFYNTPARLKFLKSPATEVSHILNAVSRQAMAHPAIRIRLTHNNKTLLDLPSSLSIKERVFQLYGSEIAENVVEFASGRDVVHIHGLLGRPTYTRSDRTYQDFYVNRRAVKNPSLTHALYGAYRDMLMRDRHPVAFVFIEIDPTLVDVNVHPSKAEVRFRNQSQIHDLVQDAIRQGLRAQGIPAVGAASGPALHAEAVKEALTAYLGSQHNKSNIQESGTTAPRYGRRKSDAGSTPLNFDYGARRETPGDLRLQPDIHPEHDLFPLAQIHDSFIIAQSNEGMAIIDQHAAHERVLFEKLQDQFTMSTVEIQNLLVPDQLQVGPAQSSLLSEYLLEMIKLGFIVEDFGSGTFMIKAVPALLVGADYKKLLLDILDEVNIHGKSRKLDELRDEILSIMACHPAVKVHRALNRKEMESLLDDLFKCRMPHTCPHGRPTVVRFSFDELKKMFKRG